jgi:hypothetical protein
MDLHLDLPRPYLPWVWLHTWDWILWTGLAMMLLWWAGILRWLRGRVGEPPTLAIALLLMIVTLAVSGTARGESGRVWLVYTPFAVVAAADGLRRLLTMPRGAVSTRLEAQSPLKGAGATAGQVQPASAGFQTSLAPGSTGAMERPTLAITLAQTALMLVITVTLAVINAPDLFPRPATAANAGADTPLGADGLPAGAGFNGGDFRLAAWDARVEGDNILLRLDWQGERPMFTPYWFSALLVSPDGTPLPQAEVWQPLETRYPTSCWLPGETVSETVALPLPDGAAGDWWVSLAAFRDAEGRERLPVTLPDGGADTQVGLGPVAVP